MPPLTVSEMATAMDHVPIYVAGLFAATAAITVVWFYFASNFNKVFLIGALVWMGLQAFLSLSGFYWDLEAMPPRLLFAMGPMVLLMIIMFVTKGGRRFIDGLRWRPLTYLSVIRIPVEIVLAMLFWNGVLAEMLTFEGQNFDILAGITAPIVGYFAFKDGSVKKTLLWIWNVVSLILLFNVVLSAVFSAPFPFQMLNLDEQTIAMLYFPFVLLPTIVVPLVMFSQFASFRLLRKR